MIAVIAAKCSGCRRCEVACASAHPGRLGALTTRIWVLKDETTGADVPVVCRSCADRPCVQACPTQALRTVDLPGGGQALALDEDKCISCGLCIAACPYGAIAGGDNGIPMVCDSCGGAHACVAACNLDALVITPDPPGDFTGTRDPSSDSPPERRLQAARAIAAGLPWLRSSPAAPFAGMTATALDRPHQSDGRPSPRPHGGSGWTAHAYAGMILRCDLDRGQCATEPLDPALARRAIGGRGLNSVRLLDELTPGTKPLEPANLLMIGVGPLTGTRLATSARLTVTARSPQTGFLGDGNAGGHFAPELKGAGFDQVVISGRAKTPQYLLISDGAAQLRPADHLWGLDVWQTTDAIRRELADPGIQVLAIGPAGEAGVRFAGVVTGHSRAAARTGMGAVMGAKQLKAIAVRTARGVPGVADAARFAGLCDAIDRDILAHPGFEQRKRLGTTSLVSGLQALGILPTRHFQSGLFAAAAAVSGETLASTFKVKHKSCYNCPVHCSRFYVLPDGSMAEGPEYETLCGFTSRIGNDDLAFALRMAAEVNRQGLDSISLTEVIGWLMECAQRGLIDATDVDGLDLSWGNKATISRLVELIVRREGIGDLLADGAIAAAHHIGRGTQELVMHVKGLDVICGDPRGIKAYGLTYAIASRGADHLRAEPFFELTGDRELAEQRFGTPDAADRLAWRGKAKLVNYSEEIAFLTDALTMCKNVGLCMDILTHDRCADLLTAALGVPVSGADLSAAASTVLDAERVFNLRQGLDPATDTLPARFLHEPLSEGPSAGQVVEIDRMIVDYYRGRGWSPDGRPPGAGPANDPCTQGPSPADNKGEAGIN